MSIDHIFDEITLLTNEERDNLYRRIRTVYYSDETIVAHTGSGEPLTKEQYIKRVEEGIAQCKQGKCSTLESLCSQLGYTYDDL